MKYGKFLMLVLVLLFALNIPVMAAPYAEEKCGENATWQIDGNDTLIISGTGAVTSAPWYNYHRYSFDKIVIGEGITSMADESFLHCLNLRQVTFPASLTSIGADCFSGCDYLQSVTYNGTLEQWRQIAFADKSSPLFQAQLTCTDRTVNLCGSNIFWTLEADGNLSITGSGAMCDFAATAPAPWHELYSSIKTVTIAEGITTIGSFAFYNLDPVNSFAITSVTLPRSLVCVGFMAFSDCTQLTDVYYGDNYDSWKQLTIDSLNEMLQSITLHTSDRTVSLCGQATFWKFDDQGTLTIYGEGPTADWTGNTKAPWHSIRINIKNVVVCEGVTHLGNRAFAGSDVKEATLANSVLSIGNYAFENSRLERITVSSWLTKVGEGAFEECDRLTAIQLPNTVTAVGRFAFRNCSSLKTAILGTGLTTLGKEAFFGCSALTEMVLADGVTVIDECTFLGCKAMTQITLPKNLQTIGGGAFQDCTSLTEIQLPDSITKVDYQAFCNCTGLTEIRIPGKVEMFDPGAVIGCLNLAAFRVDKNNTHYASDSAGVLYNKAQTVLLRAPQALTGSYRILNGVKELNYGAFYGCTMLVHITIPDSISRLPEDVFYNCSSLETVDLGKNLTYIGPSAFWDCKALTCIVLPESLEVIEMDAFSCCSNLKTVNLNDNITYIGSNAFSSCSSLQAFSWPKGTPAIKENTFAYCFGLTEVTIPNTVTAIEYGAFYQCNNLTRFTIPAGVTEFDTGVLSFCGKLTELRVDPANPNYMSDGRGVLFTKDKTTLLYAPGGLAGTYEIPNGTTTVVSLAIAYCDNLTQLVIPASVTTIEPQAIYYNKNLAAICVENNNPNYASDDSGVLYNKNKTLLIASPDKLTGYYEVAESVTAIEQQAFRFTGLTSIYIPASVTEIGWATFAETPLKQVYYAGTRSQWQRISVADGNDGLSKATVAYESGKVCNHNYSNWGRLDDIDHGKTCAVCQDVQKEAHKWDAGTTIRQASCKEGGQIKYTCTVCSATKTEDTNKTNNHSYGSWTKLDNALHKHICSVCNKEEATNHSWDHGNTTKQPTCKDAGVKTYACSECSATKTEGIEKLTTHTYDHTCDTDCNICGATRLPSHSYGASWKNDKINHWRECSICKDKTDLTSHTPGAEATETQAQTCTVCDYVIEPAKGHTHKYSTAWTADENGHWYSCSGCSGKDSYAAHEYENACDPDCATCGYTRDTKHESDEKWTVDASNHWHTCAVCGIKLEEAAHIPGEEATATAAQTCTVCNYEITPALGNPETPTDATETPSEEEEEPTTETEPPAVVDDNDSQWCIVIVVVCVVIIGTVAFVVIKKRFDS